MSVTEIDKMLVENANEELVYKDGAIINYSTGEVVQLDKESQRAYEEYLFEWQ